ncbi:hypothetical protein PG996_015960 [Apiospora saccharicola]|uniref:Polyketide synthase n=1 Tax=Apiospora saccharicola TaxID=335842 RepID=A0ABR1TMK6_9PEZI
MDKRIQSPIAVVGMACRLPGHCNSPQLLWEFIKQGKVAGNTPPSNRFNLGGHYDGSQKPLTMKTPGGMFMEDLDPADFDASFFNISYADACSMDPQQRLLLEVSYECLESGGIAMESISGQKIGCIVGASAVDYQDMGCRDPEDRVESPTLGLNRALLSNRISHFFNIHGPSFTIDTACSSTLVALDVACLYLHSGQADGMIIGGANLYLSPERNEDMGTMRDASSSTGRCHVFDAKADGYVVGEAVNAVYLKRLDDALKDGDPIRAVIRGTASNSSGRTPGITMPSPDAQAAVIRSAYASAGIPEHEFHLTGYAECHGTGTQAGDPIEIQGLQSVFASTRSSMTPLMAGSLKGNIGHSEAAAGLSGLIKAVLAIEHGVIPGTATFLAAHPGIDFDESKVRVLRRATRWPRDTRRRVSVNSFGFGGSNAHAVVESPAYLLGSDFRSHKSAYLDIDSIGGSLFSPMDDQLHPNRLETGLKLVVVSANDENSLQKYIDALCTHLINPMVQVSLGDLAYTLSERRSHLHCRAYGVLGERQQVSKNCFSSDIRPGQGVRIALVFTGQGAQWSAMGKDLLAAFPLAKEVILSLEAALASLPEPPGFSLLSELSQERHLDVLRSPELSQPLVTALQLAYLRLLLEWGVEPVAVVGHSSGEIAAAVAAGYLSYEEAIKVAYLRGQAVKQSPHDIPLGMLAVGLSADEVARYLDQDDRFVQIACFNSPRSLTLSGVLSALEELRARLEADGHFARLLHVSMAYHSDHLAEAGTRYLDLLRGRIQETTFKRNDNNIAMISTVDGTELGNSLATTYWVDNLVSPVRFDSAMTQIVTGPKAANFIIEVGPSNALDGPISHIFEAVKNPRTNLVYAPVAKRGSDCLAAFYRLAGKMFAAGATIHLAKVNDYESQESSPTTLVGLPKYEWNHTNKYWYEGPSSKDWRFRPFVRHDLLGTKVLGTSWLAPMWRNSLRLSALPWLADHRLGGQVVFPGSAYICMALEAAYQAKVMTQWGATTPESYEYQFRDIKFTRGLILEEGEGTTIMLSLANTLQGSGSWQEFRIYSKKGELWTDHATGLVKVETDLVEDRASKEHISDLRYPSSPSLWYKAMAEAGFIYGPSFQKHLSMEFTAGSRSGRSLVSLEPPPSAWPQSGYAMHPACMDGCFQTVVAPILAGDRCSLNAALVPYQIDALIVPTTARRALHKAAISLARAEYSGVGRRDASKNYAASCSVYAQGDGQLLLQLSGLRFQEHKAAVDNTLSHAYTQLVWDTDITHVFGPKLQVLTLEAADVQPNDGHDDRTLALVARLADLVAFKNPNLKVMEINLDPADTSCWWLDDRYPHRRQPGVSVREAYSHYEFISSDASTVVNVKEGNTYAPNTTFSLADFTRGGIATGQKFDLVIVKSYNTDAGSLVLGNVRSQLADCGFAIIVEPGASSEAPLAALADHGFGTACFWESVTLARPCATIEEPSSGNPVFLVNMKPDIRYDSNIDLKRLGLIVAPVEDLQSIQPESHILILDELHDSVAANMTQAQWDIVQNLVDRRCKVLWVTAGAQMEVRHPDRSVIAGMFRVIRNEAPHMRLINLDVEFPSGEATTEAIRTCLSILISSGKAPLTDYEFAERRGCLHVSRVFPDHHLDQARDELVLGRQPLEQRGLHAAERTIRIQAERVGEIDSLCYAEVAELPPSAAELGTDWVEIEVRAAGVNFKDAAATIGTIPENEHLLGGEGSGVVTRSCSSSFAPGQRVAFFARGAFGNRLRAKAGLVRAVPEGMTLEQAATVPIVYMTALYALVHLARVKRHDRVLIHSAAGGVGIAALQLCRHFGAVAYVTVGTQEKRDFLKSAHKIPEDRIYSSRSSAFGKQIMEHTGGNGIDIILNSLAGDLLDESWRLVADGGRMIEIGKRDILERNRIPMGPFIRNATFQALDLSHQSIGDGVRARLLADVFDLLEAGHVQPIAPIRTFSFAEVPGALRLIRSGNHIGKIVISDDGAADVDVSVRPLRPSMRLRADRSYLIVGGLKGICGGLALYLASAGARHLTVMARSGFSDEKSEKIVQDTHACGCEIRLVKGDVTCLDDVLRALRGSIAPVAGIIQGSMVLRDRTFDAMTLQQYHEAIACKLRGTWNLHHASMESGPALEFFTMLSSLSGIRGTKGQANYAAGSTFLDAFAAYRRQLNLPACSIDLGIVEDIGYMAEHEAINSRHDSTYWHRLSERVLRTTFELSVLRQQQQNQPWPISGAHTATTQILTGIRVPHPKDSPLLSIDQRFAGLRTNHNSGGNSSNSDSAGKHQESKDVQALRLAIHSSSHKIPLQTSSNNDGDDDNSNNLVLELAAGIFNRYFTKSLRMSEPLDPTRPLAIYGIDSLAAVEFRNFVQNELGVYMTTLEVVDAPSLYALCEKAIRLLLA